VAGAALYGHRHGAMNTPRYSIMIPTFRRGESLAECLESVCALDYPLDELEVLIVDNGGTAEHTQAAAEPYMHRLQIRYLINPVNRGFGFSVNRAMAESTGDRLWLLTDDVRPLPDLLRECDALLARDPMIGYVGCRAIETGYLRTGGGIGRIAETGEVTGNFDIDCGQPIEVEHVYGFSSVFTREALNRAGVYDRTLLSKPYSSGDRTETDHCLSVRDRGLKVVYHPGMAAVHLAKPRPDMSEISLRWKLNSIRNTLYLYLKHYGFFGKRAAALRLTFLVDVGLISALRHPSRANVAYFMNGLRARASAYAHALLFLLNQRRDSVAAFRDVLDRGGQ
jgi:GT2 family glycosyltransferase